MANFRTAGPPGSTIVTWLENIALPATAANLVLVGPNMEQDDPWDWSMDRVVQEFCTSDRSWQLRSASMIVPDPVSLGKALREQEVTGDSLLNDIDDATIRSDFGLRTIGQRAFVNHGINALRLRSAKYQAQLQVNQRENNTPSRVSLDEIADLIRRSASCKPSGQQEQPRNMMGSHGVTPVQGVPELMTARASEAFSDHEGIQVDDSTSWVDGKRQKLDNKDPAANVNHSFADIDTVSEQRMLIPAPEVTSSLQGSGKKRKRIAPTLITAEIDPNRYRGLPTAADSVVINDPERIDEPAATVVQVETPKVEPGIPFIDANGRKRLVPVWQAGLQPSTTNAAEEAPKSTSDKITASKAKTPSTSSSYLGRQKMSVDELFFSGIAMKAELPEVTADTEFSLVSDEIPSGRRLYVHNTMKRFLQSKSQEIVRDNRVFAAVIPYSEKLTLKRQTQSFFLFYESESGAHARREELQWWPEIGLANLVHGNTVDSHVSSFNPTGPGILNDFSRYEETFDPSYLENKYKYVEGGDEVLTIYGHSDEENDYDAATWKEIEDERGEMPRPLKSTRRAHISVCEVEEAIDQGITDLVAIWAKKKLPKLHNRGYRLWRKSRKQGDKRVRITAIQEDLKILVRRVANMRKEILEDVWTSKAQVLKQIPIMEVDVFAREEMNWRIRILEQRFCPDQLSPKPSVVRSKPTVVALEDGESIESESHVSSSDDGLGDFVVEDELLPSTEQQLHELDLADSEDESAEMSHSGDPDAAISDISMSDPREYSRNSAEEAEESNGRGPKKNRFGSIPLSSPSPNSESTPVKSEQSTPQFLPGPSGNINSEICDLTNLVSSDDSADVIDLVTPQKPKIKLNIKSNSAKRGPSPIVIVESDEDPMPDEDQLPPLDDPKTVSKFSYVVWAKLLDRKRLLVRVFYRMQPPLRKSMLNFLSNLSEHDLWGHIQTVIEALKEHLAHPKDMNKPTFQGVKGMDQTTFEILAGYIKLFEIYMECCYRYWREMPDVSSIKKFIPENASQFKSFFDLCVMMQDIFPGDLSSASWANAKGKGKAINVVGPEGDSDDEDARVPIKRHPKNISDSEDEVPQASSQKRKRVIYENADARDKREQVVRRLEEQAERRKILRANMAKDGHGNDEARGRIIINDAAGEDENLIYITPHIASRIKEHQIEGVRFMWNQIVAGGVSEELMQGCLLAHTMGLGKTMQVITLLVAIAEAAASVDPLISKQIPDKFQRSQTLVLCPPGLVDNWMDELLTWVPNDVLGPLEKITSTLTLPRRLAKIEEWNQDGGVLIIGYDMFRNLVVNKKRKNTEMAALTDDQHDLVMEHLLKGPNIIVADEAHKMKNSSASITSAASRFESNSRIALTGSPLANNVEEYHAMIDWVAPNYLGPIVEFRAKYVEPIQIGLWSDSTGGERRKALKMLKVLNDTLTPKVNRADMSVLRNDLPPKKEFVITVPLTNLQRKAYSLYVRSMASSSASTTKSGEVTQTTIWHWLTVLSLICNHPKCFDTKIHDRKDESRKVTAVDVDAPSPRDTSDGDGAVLDMNAPAWKIGVSQELITIATKMFREETANLDSIDLSNKVKILCQILDASKAANDKVLVFSSSIPTLNFLEQTFRTQGRDYARLDGKTRMDKRQGMSKKFNKGSTDIFLISTAAGGLGLNLPGANRVVIFDFKFNPIMEEQAVGRAYRIGQMKSTFVYRFVAGGTFEDHVHNKTVFKMQLASRVVDKKTPVAYATRKLSDFLFEPKDVRQHDLSEFQGMDPSVLDRILATQTKFPTICKIVQTDTFEKDDEDKLTAEEEKEATILYEDEFLRRTNPRKWHAVQAERNQAEYVKQMVAAQHFSRIQAQQRAQQQALPKPVQLSQQSIPARTVANSTSRPTSTAASKSGPQLSDQTPRLLEQQLAKTNGQAPLKSGAQESQSSIAQTSNHTTSGSKYTLIKDPAILPQPRDLVKTGPAQLPQSNVTTATRSKDVIVRSPSPDLELSNSPARIPSEASKVISPSQTRDTSPQDLLSASVKRPRTNYEQELQKFLESAARSSYDPDLAHPDSAIGRARNLTQLIRVDIERRFQQRRQRRSAMKAANTVLQENPKKCQALFSSSLSIGDFIGDLSVPLVEESIVARDDGIFNSKMLTAMARKPDRSQGSQGLVTEGRAAEKLSSRVNEDKIALQKINKKRRARGEEEITPRKMPPRIPGWAEEQIGEAKNRHGSSRSLSHASPHRV